VLGDINADLLHHLNSFGVHIASGARASTMDDNEIARRCAQDAFSQMASAGISRT
jgi:hypothetical protein